MQKTNIYLDYNATAPLSPKVIEGMQEVMKLPCNASSVHVFGRKAKAWIEAVRLSITRILEAEHAQLLFLSSGSEANNLALRGVRDHTIIVSSIEHSSILQTAQSITKNAIIAPVDRQGVLDLEKLEHILKITQGKCLISVMLANNEIGVIQPIKKVVELAHKFDALVHTDAVQAVGKIPVSMAELGVDMMTVSAHKYAGPQGIAALLIRKGISLLPQITGGGQEFGYRAGTHNLPAIVGFGIATETLEEMLSEMTKIRSLRDWMEETLLDYNPELAIYGKEVDRLPNTSYIAMPGVTSEVQVMHFDLEGIAVSAGAACSSGKIKVSHVLQAMGTKSSIVNNGIRISLGSANSKKELEKFIQVWKELYQRTHPVNDQFLQLSNASQG